MENEIASFEDKPCRWPPIRQVVFTIYRFDVPTPCGQRVKLRMTAIR